MQHKKRGRPRLRDEENGRNASFRSEFAHPQLYPAQSEQPEVLSMSHTARGHQRSASYRELRSQPGVSYHETSMRPDSSRPSDYGYTNGHMSNHVHQYGNSRALPESIPTAVLTLDFLLLRSNHAFSDALSLRTNPAGLCLKDLVLPTDREKIHRLQSSLRSDLRTAPSLPPYRLSPSRSSHITMDEEQDLLGATAGFQPRSEYWTFRLPGEQSRGFPISICMAKSSGYFVVLTFAASAKPLMSLPPPRTSSTSWSQPMTSAAPVVSPTLERSHQAHHFNGMSPVKSQYSHYPATNSYDIIDAQPRMFQYASNGAERSLYKRSPQQAYDRHYSTTSTGTTGSSVHSSDIPRESLRLPPIRTSSNGENTRPISSKVSTSHRRETSVKGSPQSSQRKKRQRVGIVEILR